MTTMHLPFPAPRFGLVLGAVILLTASSCDGGTTVQAVPDWGGGKHSPYVPEGYSLTFEDNFDPPQAATGAQATDADGRLTTGQVKAGPPRAWDTHWVTWNIRHLEGNNDQALKADAAFRGQGGPTLAEHGITLHELTPEGTLKLYAHETPQGLVEQFGMPYLGGMITAEESYSQTYGYWEMRIRLNSVSAGQHWAFWLLPDADIWPPEIDMLEAVGSNPSNQSDADYFFFNSILTDPNSDEITRVQPPRGKNAWYTLGFLWTETDMRWFLDGQEVRQRPAMGGDVSLYVLISPEVGGHWVGAPTADTAWPMEAEIDYIRVYREG